MRNLFALLVGIDRYDRPEVFPDLGGPVNDLAAMELSLDCYCRKTRGLRLHKRILKDAKATREAISDGFALFDRAASQDVCLFYFSGHGAQIHAPKELGYEADEMLEALVCRMDKGNDNLLIDKELSYLIARAQYDKDVHFVVITDCCHSGSNTKEATFAVRSAPSDLDTRKVDDYLGRAEYVEIRNPQGELERLRPPMGRHVKLGACSPSELAKEKMLGEDGATRGVFTYALLQALKENGYKISYGNLAAKTRIKIQTLVRDQSPQVETVALVPEEANRLYLNGLLAGAKPTFQVCYEEGEHRWVIDAGQIYGLHVGDVALLAAGARAPVREVSVSRSVLDAGSLAHLDKKPVYDATIESHGRKPLNLAFAPESDGAATKMLRGLLKETACSTISLDPQKGVDYMVYAVDGTLALTHPEERIPVFSRITGQGKAEGRLFLNLVEQVAEWQRIIAIANPNTTIGEDDIGIELRQVEHPHRFANPDLAPTTLVPDWHTENVFRYTFDDSMSGDPWRPPAFRLSITNRSGRKFLAGALYCGSGYIFDRTHYTSTSFSITNQFLECEELADKGQIARLTDEISDPNTNRHVAFESIQLSLLDDYFDRGYNEIKDLVKVFISTDRLETRAFNMKGIPIDTKGVLAKRNLGEEAEQPDWRTFEIPITIVKPRDMGIVSPGQARSFYGLTIEGHQAFSARVVLSTVEELIRSTAAAPGSPGAGEDGAATGRLSVVPRPEIAFGNENVRTVRLTDGLGDVEGCAVIEFYRAAGTGGISEAQPLRFKVDSQVIPVEAGRRLVLAGYSPADRTYRSLAAIDAQQEILVPGLPPESPSQVDGLGNSIKLLLLSVRAGFDIPPLATATAETRQA